MAMGIDQEIALIALVMSVAALWMVLQLRTRLGHFPAQLKALRTELEETRRELTELKAATEVAPAPPLPPLPRTRSGGLDDLREQLRAAHREADDADT
jgi:hypothetical protein